MSSTGPCHWVWPSLGNNTRGTVIPHMKLLTSARGPSERLRPRPFPPRGVILHPTSLNRESSCSCN